MNELFSIAGKVAVITGAGGVLGGNIAQHFVQQGAKDDLEAATELAAQVIKGLDGERIRHILRQDIL